MSRESKEILGPLFSAVLDHSRYFVRLTEKFQTRLDKWQDSLLATYSNYSSRWIFKRFIARARANGLERDPRQISLEIKQRPKARGIPGTSASEISRSISRARARPSARRFPVLFVSIFAVCLSLALSLSLRGRNPCRVSCDFSTSSRARERVRWRTRTRSRARVFICANGTRCRG